MTRPTLNSFGTQGGAPVSPERVLQRFLGWGVLAAILLLGLMLRVYRLQEQSAWLDERNIVGCIQAPSVGACLTFIRAIGPEVVPLYFSTLFMWARLVGTDVETLRFLSILLSLVSIALVYLIAADVYSRKTAALAALLAALSPFHLDLAQAPRPIALFEVLALLSLFALIRAVRRNGLWWWAALLANAALVWTHILGLFLLAAEGLFVLVWDLGHKRVRHLLLWGTATCLTAVSPYLWLRQVTPYMQEPDFDFIMSLPPLKMLLADWLADDAVMLNDPFAFQGQTWPFLSTKLQAAIVGAHPAYDAALMVLFAAVLAWVAVRLLWRAFNETFNVAHESADASEALLLCFGLLPLLLMLIVTLAWRPCILPRYTCYSSYAIYILCAGVLMGFRSQAVRRGGVGALVILYGCQLSLALPATTRTDYLSVSRYIKSHASPQDYVLVKGPFVAWETFCFNFGTHSSYPILPVYSFQALCEDSRAFFLRKENADVSLWTVVEPFVYTLPPRDSVEACFQRCGLSAERTDFPGMNGLQLYRVRPSPGLVAAPTPCCTDVPAKADYAGIVDGLELGGLPKEQRAYAMKAVRRAVDTEWPQSKFYYMLLSFTLDLDNTPKLGEYAARRIILTAPDYGFGYFALSVALAEQGDIGPARAALAKACEVDTIGYFRYYKPLFDALYLQQDRVAAQRELGTLDRMGVLVPPILRVRAGLLPGSDSFPPR